MSKNIKLGCLLKPIIFIFFAVVLEVVNFLWVGFKVTGSQETLQVFPKYFIIDLSIISLIAGVIFLCSRKWSNFVFYLFLGLQLAVNMINATLFKVFGDIFSFDMMKLGGEALAAFKFEFIDFWSIALNLFLLGVIILIQIVLDRKVKKEVVLKKTSKFSFVLISFFAIFSFSCFSFSSQLLSLDQAQGFNEISQSDEYLWDNMHFKLEAYKKFGTYGFYLKSLSNLLYKKDNYNQKVEADLKNEILTQEQGIDVTAELYGDNLIVIMMESFEWYAIDPFNTPTLWDIKQNSGVTLLNFHSKNKTNMSEDIVLLGSMPKDSSMTSLAKKDYLNSRYSLANMFNNLGYTSNFFHTYKKTFYDRDKINKSIGFDNVYGIEDAKLANKSTKFGNWNLDSDYTKAMIEKIAPTDQKFFSFFTTVTTHGPYDQTNERFKAYYAEYDQNIDSDGIFGNYATTYYKKKGISINSEGYKNWMSKNSDFFYPTNQEIERAFRQYKCAAMDTDRMVGFLIEYLEQNNILNDTTIIMYSDHNSYYHDLIYNIKGVSKEDYYDNYIYNVPCMIYSKKLSPKKITSFTNTYDLYPTIAELFGLNYTKALTQGYNIFSSDIENSVMVSYLSGIFNGEFYTLNIVDMFIAEGASQDSLERFKKNASRFYEKQQKIELIYKYGLAK